MMQAPFNPGIFGNPFLRGDQFNPETAKSESPYQFKGLPDMNDPNNPMMHTQVMPWNPNMGRIDMSQILGQMPKDPNRIQPMVEPRPPMQQPPTNAFGMQLQPNKNIGFSRVLPNIQARMQQSNPMNRMQPQQMNQQVHSNQNMGKNSKALGSYGGF